MATKVQSVSGLIVPSNTTKTLTLPSAVTAGNTIIVTITAYDPTNAVTWSITDNKNGATTYTSAEYVTRVITGTETENAGISFIPNTAGSTGANSFIVSIAFTHGDVTNGSVCTAMEVSGLATSPLDRHNNASAVSSSSSATVTNALANQASSGIAVSSMVLYGGSATEAISASGYTNLGINNDGNAANPSSADYKILSATETTSVTYSHSHTLQSGWGVALATFQDVSSGTTLTAASGSYSLSGQTATLANTGSTLALAFGSYSLSGQAENNGIKLPLAFGSYALTGQGATLASSGGSSDFTLLANSGSYVLQGASSASDLDLPLDFGSYSLAGQADTSGISQPLVFGTYGLTGQAATLTAAGGGDFFLIANSGSYGLTGFAATLTQATQNYFLAANFGQYTLNGQQANLVGPPVIGQGAPMLMMFRGALRKR